MEGCQGCSTGTDAVDAVAQFIDRTAEAVDSLVALPELAAVDGIGRILADRTRCNACDLITTCIDAILINSYVLYF